ncbi:MAG: hypothetical protein VX777_04275 [Chlamydiota bacterium]|nr:hypothetical protein [Chlamydiota bacterium]
MVIRYFILPLFVLLTMARGLYAEDVRIGVQLDDKSFYANRPITGTINIQHNKIDQINVSSFKIENSTLKVDFMKVVEIGQDSSLMITFYRFELPPQEPGLRLLPEISVNIGGKLYKSTPLTYEVIKTVKVVRGEQGVVLDLESFVEGNSSVYVGQNLRVGYRFYFNDNFDLIEQQLPLLEANGFKKIGKERINDIKQNGMSVRQIDQNIEAIKPGKYVFGPSYVTASIYRKDRRGKKQVVSQDIKAEAEELTITVLDFPIDSKPASFNGAVGQDINFSVELMSPAQVNVGDKLSLSLTFSGVNDDSNIKIPEICCQPGYAGFFGIDDMPPLPSKQSGVFRYFVDIRPLTDKIKKIPTLEFSYFNPVTESYTTEKSEPIEIKVSPQPEAEKQQTVDESQTQNQIIQQNSSDEVVWPTPSTKVQPIEINTIYPLEVGDLNNKYFGTWAVILIIPFGALAIYVQFDIRERHLSRISRRKKKKAVDVFNEALKSTDDLPIFYQNLCNAFFMRFKEVEMIDDIEITAHQLPQTGVCGEVRDFLCGIEERRFSGKGDVDTKEIIITADRLFKKIEGK